MPTFLIPPPEVENVLGWLRAAVLPLTWVEVTVRDAPEPQLQIPPPANPPAPGVPVSVLSFTWLANSVAEP